MARGARQIAVAAAARPTTSAGRLLLGRDSFREGVLDRDGHRCVICGRPQSEVKLDVHHITERRLFDDGGYYLDNGVSLCDAPAPSQEHSCHMRAELTLISPAQLREAAGITGPPLLPPGFDIDAAYTKWGDMCNSDGTRAPGPLFYEEPVQKVLRQAGLLDRYRQRFRFPRTLHLPWSPNRGADGDHVQSDLSAFEGREVQLSVKLDGEATTMGRDYIHARSIDSNYHPTRTWVRSLHGQIAHEIPEGWRICGENCYGQHSIVYDQLPTYFFVYAIFDERNQCLSVDEMGEYAELLGLATVPVAWRGQFDEAFVRDFWPQGVYGAEPEGYVLRVTDAFSYYQYSALTGKSVRKDHVKTEDGHWSRGEVLPNRLAANAST